ncbi:MAG: MFS transporter [Rickettsiaceae bacterium]|nr:MFS transporter [Rickettsiaceae bacterium]
MSHNRKVFLSAISGNILEYYDFTVYAVFSIVIGKNFFPAASEAVQVLSSLAVFAIGFVTRPIGGILFGYIGDIYGRRIALICSMVGMTMSTFSMGLIPDYSHIGIYAPVLLVMMRLIQGLCISGEGTGAAIFILEHYGNLRAGFVTGIVQGSNIFGSLIATFVGMMLEHSVYSDYAWRIAFLLGGIMGMMGFYVRLKVSETPIFEELRKNKQKLKAPFFHVVKNAWRPMILTICIAGTAGSIVQMIKSYVNVFFQSVMHLSSSTALGYLSYTLFITMLSMASAGALSDFLGKTKMMILSATSMLLFSLPVFLLMSSSNYIYQIMSLTMLGMIAGAIAGNAYIFVISLFTPEERFTGVSFSYNLGVAIFGGTTGFISTWLVKNLEMSFAPAFYLIFTSSSLLLVIYLMRNRIRKL